MFKKLIFAVFLSIIFNGAKAQKINFGLYGSLAYPTGYQGKNLRQGYGGGVTLSYYFNNFFDLGLKADILRFETIDEYPEKNYLYLKPVQLTAGFHKQTGLLDLYGKLGGTFYIIRESYPGFTEGYPSFSKQNLGITPCIGVSYYLGQRLSLDFSVSYFLTFDAEINSLAAHLGLKYDLFKF